MDKNWKALSKFWGAKPSAQLSIDRAPATLHAGFTVWEISDDSNALGSPENFSAEAACQRVSELQNNLLLDLRDHLPELTAVERLYVIDRCFRDPSCQSRTMADALHDAGCYMQAGQLYAGLGHWRKAGDCYLAVGSLEQAAACYKMPGDTSLVFRKGPDIDRLLGMAFRASAWSEVIDLLKEGEPSAFGYGNNQIIFAGSTRSRVPLLRFAAIAAVRLGRSIELAKWVSKSFGINLSDWHILCKEAAIAEIALQKEKEKSFPPKLRSKLRDKSAALEIGSTQKAKSLAEWIEQLPQTFPYYIAMLSGYYQQGDEEKVDGIVKWLISPGIYKLVRTILFHVENETSNTRSKVGNRLAFYRSHPWITRSCMSDYLKYVLVYDSELSANDILICLYQHLSHLDQPLTAISIEELQNPKSIELLYRLRRSDAWAEAKLQSWLKWDSTVSAIGRCRMQIQSNGSWMEPRKNRDWATVMDSAADFLEREWQQEISDIIWKSEEIAFQAIQSQLNGITVEKHARPVWLSPQHLDIFVPEYNLAIEYMGLQHYQPVEFFGGEECYKLTVKRDARKAKLCSLAGVRLEYIRYDEDIKNRIGEIFALLEAKS